MKKIKEPNLVEGATLFEMFDYLCGKVDWGRSNLDSTAVVCMNILFMELRKNTKKIKDMP